MARGHPPRPARGAVGNELTNLDLPLGDPFRDAEHAWLWFCSCELRRLDGARNLGGGTPRPIEPADVYLVAVRAFVAMEITGHEWRVMWRFGLRQAIPDRRFEPNDLALWRCGVAALDPGLRRKQALVEYAKFCS